MLDSEWTSHNIEQPNDDSLWRMNSANIESIIESYIDHYDWNITEEDIRKYFDNNSGIKITDTTFPIIVALIHARLWQRNAENTTLKLQWQVEWLTHDIL